MSSIFNLKLFLLVIIFAIVESKHHNMHARITKQAVPPAGPTVGPPGGKPTPKKPNKPGDKIPGGFPASNDGAPPEVSWGTYLGWGSAKYWWLSKAEVPKEEAEYECASNLADIFDKMQAHPFDRYQFYLTVLQNKEELVAVNRFLDEIGYTGDIWIAGESKMQPDGKEILIMREPNSLRMMDLQDANLRFTREVSTEQQLISRSNPMGKRKRDAAGGAAAHVTVIETHYPWLANWKDEGGCRDIKACRPIQCNVTTPPCIISTTGCAMNNKTECKIVPSGNCSAICESCDITIPPDCWMAENKCTVIRERQCKMSEPECQVTTPPCTITRPPCITKQNPCNVNTTVAPECEMPPECGTAQGIQCKQVPRDCYPEEPSNATCTKLMCAAAPVCMLPVYCRQGGGITTNLDCPPPTTFCPPEIVKCPPPEVTCDEPKLECSDPEIYCPPPQVVCSQPQVTCSSPAISCPTVITNCLNPEVECAPPQVECDPPQLSCSEPQPCFVGKPSKPICHEKCDDTTKCRCQALKHDGKGYMPEPRDCAEKHPVLCIGHPGNVVDEG